MYRLPPLNALRAFEVAARHMSFQKAAEELRVTPSALSYQIRQLEEFLQVPLFERLNRAVRLTEAGQRIAPGVKDGFERLSDAIGRLKNHTSPNVLIVSTGPSFAAKWLSPRLHKFIEHHPDIDIRISANLKLADFRDDEVDVAIRFGAGKYPGLHVEPLSDEHVLPLVSPRLLEQFGGNLRAEDLGRLTLLHDDSANFLSNAANWEEWLRLARIEGVETGRGPHFSHADHALEAALDGAGIVLGRLTLSIRDIALGRLVAPFDLMLRAQAGFFFCCLPERLGEPKIKAFRKFLFDEITSERAFLTEFRRGKRQI
jgi:LysR family transcriptional regulator, glycine cleavage system transcriptional activator